MSKICITIMVVAVIYCAQAAPAASFGDDPFGIMSGIQAQMQKMMSPEFMKNQKGDFQSVSSSSHMENGKNVMTGVIRSSHDGKMTEQFFSN